MKQLNYKLALLAALTLAGCTPEKEFPATETDVVESLRVSLSSGADTADDGGTTETSDPTGFVTLRGTFKVDGEAPSPAPLSITKDASVCAPGGKTVYSGDIVVDSATGALANVLIYVDNKKMPESWLHADAAPGANTDKVVFDQKECIFLTRMVAIQTSQTLRVLNSDPIGHNLMVGNMNETIPAGGETAYEPRKEERSPLEMKCSVHPWMKAWFINRDNAYFAVTKEDGSFEIPNLPAGVPLEFKVWHERIGAVQEVTVDGTATKWSKGKLELTLDASSDKTMDVVLDASTLN